MSTSSTPSSPLIIGLTGGIGSGKSAASDHLESLGINIVDTDIVARLVVAPNTPALQQISDHFGSTVLLDDGNLDRAQLRNIIFQDPAQKTWLEALLHPIIRQETLRQLNQSNSPYTVLVSPLLLETNQHELCDRVLVIDVPEEIQVQRASHRDNNDTAQIKRIIASQIHRDKRLALADDIIDNSQDLAQLQENIAKLHQQYLTLSKAV